jgi:catechol 2,3-dioxygenase-like lactoylglutathione lyase family enzyme
MIKRFLHVAITVEDFESSIKTYEALGMKEVERFDCPEPKASVLLMEDHNGTGVELWKFIDKEHPDMEFVDGHNAYETNALDEDIAQLLGQGFAEVGRRGEDDTLKFAYLRSPNGKVIELCEYNNPKP